MFVPHKSHRSYVYTCTDKPPKGDGDGDGDDVPLFTLFYPFQKSTLKKLLIRGYEL